MTARLSFKPRTTAAERRQQRVAYKQLKAEIDASPAMQERRSRARTDAQRSAAKKKLNAALAGRPIRPFSALQLAQLTRQEVRQLRARSAARYQRLRQEERDRLRDNLFLALVTFSDADYRVLVEFGGTP